MKERAQFDSLPLLSSLGVLGKEKSIGLGGGAAVSPYWIARSCDELEPVEALKAALTSWPRVELVRMERRWRGLNVVEGMMCVCVCVVVTVRSGLVIGLFERLKLYKCD
jgi:hypothetical protein